MEEPLYDALCSRETLYWAWQKVKEKNTAEGIDHKTVGEYAVTIDKNLEELERLLVTGTYIQQPYREIFIPKNATEKRRLGLLTVQDKIVQTAVYQLILPQFEKGFLNVSYGYRAHKGPVKAIHRVQHYIENEGFTWMAVCDIDNFFDSIPHNPLFGKLSGYLKSPRITELIVMFVRMGRVNKHLHWKDSHKGIPQGGVISPLLANFYLYTLDKFMVDNRFGFVRYADDFVIFTRNEEDAAKALQGSIQILTEKLGLTLNEGAEVKPVAQGFEFLGITFKDKTLALSDQKFHRLTEKMAEAAGTGQGFITKKLLEVNRGIAEFYGKLVPQTVLERLDDELMHIMKLRLGALKEEKIRIGNPVARLHEVAFFASSHNMRKSQYIAQHVGPSASKKSTKPIPKGPPVKPFTSREAVIKRKHEYQKLESSGFDLVLSQAGLVLGKRENTVFVKKDGVVMEEVTLANLRNVTLLSEGISLSSNAIHACCEKNVSIDFLHTNGMPYALLVAAQFPDADIGLAQLAAYRNSKSFDLIRAIVAGKIGNQANLIKYFGKYYLLKNADFSKGYANTIETLKKYASDARKLRHDDLDEFRLKMFAIEGLSSACYWEAIGRIIQTKVPFEGRERQGAKDLVNCMLNYGYGILYARVTEAIIRARLNPCLSYLHKPEGNRPSLVYDLIEEFRQQVVDRIIVALIMKNKGLFSENGLLDDPTRFLVARKVIERINNTETFRGQEMRLADIIQKQAHALARFLVQKETIYKPYLKKW